MIDFPDNAHYAPNLDWDLLNQFVAPIRLRDIASHDENAMTALDENQHKAVLDVRSRSRKKASSLQEWIVRKENNLQDLKDYIVAQYKAHPPGGYRQLPLEYTVDLTEEENKAYYQNRYHTAHRYLLVPPFYNKWMHPNAQYINRDLNGGWSDIFAQSMESIAVIWEALCDETYPLTYSREDAKAFFVGALCELGRAHNWDQYRPDDRGGIEQYDDGEADRPSCPNGVEKRLAQTLVFCKVQDLNDRELSVDGMCTMFKEHFISDNEKGTSIFQEIERSDLPSLQQVHKAYEQWIVDGDRFDELSPEQQKLLKSFIQWTTHDVIAFINHARDYYGHDRIMNEQQHPVHPTYQFQNYGQWIIHLAKNSLYIYSEILIEKINYRITELLADPIKRRAVEQLASERAALEQTTRELEQETHELEQKTIELEQETRELEQVALELEEAALELEQVDLELEQADSELRQADLKLEQIVLELEEAALDLEQAAFEQELRDITRAQETNPRWRTVVRQQEATPQERSNVPGRPPF